MTVNNNIITGLEMRDGGKRPPPFYPCCHLVLAIHFPPLPFLPAHPSSVTHPISTLLLTNALLLNSSRIIIIPCFLLLLHLFTLMHLFPIPHGLPHPPSLSVSFILSCTPPLFIHFSHQLLDVSPSLV